MNIGASLATGAAVAVLLTAIGAFIDNYHVQGKRLERVRMILIALWTRLEANSMRFIARKRAPVSPEEHARIMRLAKRGANVFFAICFVCGIASLAWQHDTVSFSPNVSIDWQEMWVEFAAGFLIPFGAYILLLSLYAAVAFAVQGVVLVLRGVGLVILETASAPTAKPFTYFGAIAGLLGAVLNVISKLIT